MLMTSTKCFLKLELNCFDLSNCVDKGSQLDLFNVTQAQESKNIIIAFLCLSNNKEIQWASLIV